MSLKKQAVSGLAWSFGAKLITLVLQFSLNIALTRMLSPDAFGAVAMITVFSGFMMYYVEAGLGAALVHVENLEERHRSSVFWVQLGAGIALAAFLATAAPWVAAFYKNADAELLVRLTRFISLDFILVSLVLVQTWLLNRELLFRRVALIELAAEVLSGAAAIALAAAGGGAEALVLRLLGYSGFRALFLWILSSWKPRLIIDRAALRDVFAFGRDMTTHTFLNYWVRRGDDLLIGRFAGQRELGIYSRAYMIMLLPLVQVTRVVARVMFPVFARIRDDDERIRRIYLRTLGGIALVTFPMTLGLFAVSESFVVGVLGPGYRDMVPILRWFCAAGLVQSIDLMGATLFMAKGRTDLMVRWKVLSATFTLVAFATGISWGALGVAVAFTIRTFILGYFNFSIPGKLVGLSVRDVVRAVAGPLGCALLMCALVSFAALALPAGWSELTRFLGLTTLGLAVYPVLVFGLRIRAFEDVRKLVHDHLRSRKLGEQPTPT